METSILAFNYVRKKGLDTMDYFLGNKPVGKTNESKVDLSEIVRDLDELLI